MNNLNNIKRVVSWNTSKVGAQFIGTAYSFDHGTPTIVHAEIAAPTRAVAKARAQAACRSLRSMVAA